MPNDLPMYTVAVAELIEDLEEDVCELIAKGYVPTGGYCGIVAPESEFSEHTEQHAQAMVLKSCLN